MKPSPPTHQRVADLLATEAVALCQAQQSLTVAELTDDSRAVRPGWLHICRDTAGTRAGEFIAQAIEQDAAAVVVSRRLARGLEPALAENSRLIVTSAPVDQRFAGRVAERFFGQPAQQLQAIGITGTNGKTSVATLVQHLLRAADKRCGLIGTVAIDDGQTRQPNELTTPGSIELSRLLARMVANGCTHLVMEVSSHALDQGRVDHLEFAAAVFTNLSGDHLDYHRTMEQYAAAKATLFEKLGRFGWAIVNACDPYTPRMLQGCAAHAVTCRVRQPHDPKAPQTPADDSGCITGTTACYATVMELTPTGNRAVFDGPWGSVNAHVPLIGAFNMANVLQAVAAAMCFVDLSRKLKKLLPQLPAAPGRLELVGPHWPDDEPESPAYSPLPSVLVDYAHTDDALANVLGAVRPITPGKVVCLFGCGGERDASKRPRMAAVAYAGADELVITSDNPRREDPGAIITDIVAGLPPQDERTKPVAITPDRAAAIAEAVASAAPDDTVLIAGKGHEDYQVLGLEKTHFDDREQAAAALRRRAGILSATD